jgi:membrane protein YdbS with pleckstrin-like domain
MSSQRNRTVAIIVFIVAAIVCGLLGALLEQATGLWWMRYALMAIVIVPTVVTLLRLPVFRQRK